MLVKKIKQTLSLLIKLVTVIIFSFIIFIISGTANSQQKFMYKIPGPEIEQKIRQLRVEVRNSLTTNVNFSQRLEILEDWFDYVQSGAKLPESGLPRRAIGIIEELAKTNMNQAYRTLDRIVSDMNDVQVPKESAIFDTYGDIAGTVTDKNGNLLSEVTVSVFGLNKSARTDKDGKYLIINVPVAWPRYIVYARKEGYFEAQAGDIGIKRGVPVTVNLQMEKYSPSRAYLQENLNVKLGYLIEHYPGKNVVQPDWNAVLDPSMYPEKVKPYLESGLYCDPKHPVVKATAEEIINGLPENMRKKATFVAKAVYDWVVKHIEYDLIQHYPHDVTGGNWQTTWGGWGHGFNEWCYLPEETIRMGRGICIEYERMAAAIMRALKIPARSAPLKAHPVTQWWVQLPDGSGYWANYETSFGRHGYNRNGSLWSNFPSRTDESIHFYGVGPDVPIQCDWKSDNKLLWFEDYGEDVRFKMSSGNLKKAERGLEVFNKTGHFPAAEAGEALPPEVINKQANYELYSRGFEISLANLGDQTIIHAWFPVFYDTDLRKTLETLHYTNHPEWITLTWIENKENSVTGEKLPFYYIEFDVTR